MEPDIFYIFFYFSYFFWAVTVNIFFFDKDFLLLSLEINFISPCMCMQEDVGKEFILFYINILIYWVIEGFGSFFWKKYFFFACVSKLSFKQTWKVMSSFLF